MLRRLGRPLGTGPARYLRCRIAYYGIDTTHFSEETLPTRPRQHYTEDLLREAASRCTSLRQMVEYLNVPPYSSVYGYLSRRLKHFGIDTSHFAAHGSGSFSTVPIEKLRCAIERSQSYAGVFRELKVSDTTTTRRALKEAIAVHQLSTRHFTGQAHHRGKRSPRRKSADDVLRLLPAGSRRSSREQLHRALGDKTVPYVCDMCGLGDSWQKKRLVLQIDHRNGNRLDNRLENLRYLCPSCHSQTRTFARHRFGPPGGASAGRRDQ